MSLTKITYDDKSDSRTAVNEIYQVTAANINEIKTIVNAAIDEIDGIMTGDYAQIYVADGEASQEIPAGTSYTKVLAYVTNNSNAGQCTADADNARIIINETGHYYTSYAGSYTIDSNNITFRGAVFLGEVEQNTVHSGGTTGLQGAMRSTAAGGIITVSSVPAYLTVRIRHSHNDAINITHVYANLSCHKIGS